MMEPTACFLQIKSLMDTPQANDQRRTHPTAGPQLHPGLPPARGGGRQLWAGSKGAEHMRAGEEWALTSAIFSTALPFRSNVGV